MSNDVTTLFRAAVNNTGLDPLVGFDVECWVTDVETGLVVSVGQFQSCTISVRNATETYLELGQRIPIYLDGEIQIAWVLEQGLVDMDWLGRYFGAEVITRDQYLTRGPRFTISVDMDAAELNGTTPISGGINARNDTFAGSRNYWTPTTASNYSTGSSTTREVNGRYELQRCKLDSLSLGIMPGRRVIAQRWEGVAEGIILNKTSLQTFKNTRVSPTTTGTGQAVAAVTDSGAGSFQ